MLVLSYLKSIALVKVIRNHIRTYNADPLTKMVQECEISRIIN